MSRPILVLQHADYDWPGYFTDCLDEWDVPYHLVRVYQGDELPSSLEAYAGFAIMGGGMSVHDVEAFPHLKQALILVQEALRTRVPVIGHCLGGQLLALAAGGQVLRAPLGEVGWHAIRLNQTPDVQALAREWFGDAADIHLFEWHNEMFTLPASAVHLAGTQYSPNQAFVLDGIHLGMQFHCEALADKIEHWIDTARDDIAEANGENVHTENQIRSGTTQHEAVAKQVARQLYTRWLKHYPLV